MSGDLAKTLDRLYGLVPKGKALGLERMQAACDKLGNPERAFSAVHVAGTNGKGTVSAFVASIARASGKRVGLYTSPHLVRFAERIQIDGAPLDDDTLAAVLDRVMTEAPDLTFFETATLAAFLAFKEAKVDLAVLEVGLGGRLDATNVIPPPKVAVITRVAFDHMEELGDSLSKIATEKAGIIKKGTTVVVGKLHPDARDVIERQAAQVGAHLVALSSPEPIPGAALAYPRFAMFGSNLAVAVTVAQELGV
ncbi:MAG: bifunctional folylpolyglutamate synthase/dihydrofolate synthase, partial [Polyangiaceae bacterium]|nr:bifunctional folylpolyglutamate synthase/dihydrofolate synthase [Polyangiaceae bacterium]